LAVGEDPQDGKKIGAALHLVEDHEAAKPREGLHRLGQRGEVGGILEIQKQRAPSLGGKLARQRGLAALARSEQGDHRVPRQRGLEGRQGFRALGGGFQDPRIFELMDRKYED
jgi:hypothetical protein